MLKEKTLLGYLTLACLVSLGIVLYIFSLPTDPKNAWLCGLSLARWLMLAGALVLLALCTASTYSAWSNPLRRVRNLQRVLETPALCAAIITLSILNLLGAAWFAAFWQRYATDQFIHAYLLRFAPFVFWLAVLSLQTLTVLPIFQSSLRPHYLAFLFACLLVGGIKLFTNNLTVEQMPWDVKYYYLLAERGFGGYNIAPYVYRFATPFLARAVSTTLYIPTYAAYSLIAVCGAVLQLFAVHLLVRHLGFGTRTSLLAMSVVALSAFNVKYLLFDVSRPDHLAYFFMALAMLAVLTDRIVCCALLSAVGLQFREHLAIPPVLFALLNARDWLRNRSQWRLLLNIFLLGLVTALALFLPRLFIPINETTQFVDPQNPASLRNLTDMPLNLRRDSNFLFGVLAYFLPILLLLTPPRMKALWRSLRPYRLVLGAYVAIVLLLTLYGGHDIMRYLSYMFIPLVFFVCFISAQALPVREWVYALIATAIFNRAFSWIPGWDVEQFLDYYGAYGDRVNYSSLLRWLELLAWLAGAFLLHYTYTKSTRKENNNGRTNL